MAASRDSRKTGFDQVEAEGDWRAGQMRGEQGADLIHVRGR